MLFKVNGKVNALALFISIAISEGIGVLAGFLTMNSTTDYLNLKLPSFAPPGSIFAPVWAVLYLLMGIAAYRVWMHGNYNENVKNALSWYIFQLFLNFIWSILFFGLGLRGLALLDIILLFVAILITTIKFYKIDKLAGILMVPYILWVGFAAILNYSIWKLNR